MVVVGKIGGERESVVGWEVREGIIKKKGGIVVLGLLGFLLLGKSSIKKKI